MNIIVGFRNFMINIDGLLRIEWISNVIMINRRLLEMMLFWFCANLAEEYFLTFRSPRLFVQIWNMVPGLAS